MSKIVTLLTDRVFLNRQIMECFPSNLQFTPLSHWPGGFSKLTGDSGEFAGDINVSGVCDTGVSIRMVSLDFIISYGIETVDM